MTVLKFLLCSIFLFLVTKGHNLDPNSVYLGLSLLLSAWIIGSEIEKIGADLLQIRKYFVLKMSENEVENEEKEAQNG